MFTPQPTCLLWQILVAPFAWYIKEITVLKIDIWGNKLVMSFGEIGISVMVTNFVLRQHNSGVVKHNFHT